MPKLLIVPVEQKYMKTWYDTVPYQIAETANTLKITKEWQIITIDGDINNINNINTSNTLMYNISSQYAITQLNEIVKMFNNGDINNNDTFLIMNAFSLISTVIKTLSVSLNININIHGIWQEGQYNSLNTLKYNKLTDWSKHQEIANFHACDYNYFITESFKIKFLKNLKIQKKFYKKAICGGLPYSSIVGDMVETNAYNYPHRKKLIVFPITSTDTSQYIIFTDLVKFLPDDWTFYILNDHDTTTEKYYNILKQANIIFSNTLDMPFDIDIATGVLCGVIPVVPNSESYNDIYNDIFKYDVNWINTYANYTKYKSKLINFCLSIMKNYESIHNNELVRQHNILVNQYMNSRIIFTQILK